MLMNIGLNNYYVWIKDEFKEDNYINILLSILGLFQSQNFNNYLYGYDDLSEVGTFFQIVIGKSAYATNKKFTQ
jgi:hypothetical protein